MKKGIILSLLCCIYCMQPMAQDLSEREKQEDLSRYSDNGSVWNKRNLYYFVDNTSSHLTPQERLSAIMQAFDKWASITDFTFVQVYNKTFSDISFKWAVGSHGDDYPFPSDGSILAHTVHSSNNGIKCHEEIHINDDINWSMNPDSLDLVHTCMHEIGHALGLGESSDFQSIMYQYNHNGRTFTADDHEGIWSLYGCPFSIEGPSCLCQSGTYSFENIPSGYYIRWQTAGCVATGQGTNYIVVTKTDNCLGSVSVNLFNENHNVVLSLTHHIYIGTPPQTIGTGLSIIANNGTYGHWIANEAGNKFSIVGALSEQYRYFDIEAYLYKMDSNFSPTIEMWHRFYNGTQNLEVTTYSEGWYLLKVRGVNDCGYSDALEIEVEMQEINNPLQLSYNPSTEILTISLYDTELKGQSANKTSNNNAYSSSIYDIQIWNSVRMAKSLRSTSNSISISLSDLPNDMYIIKVIKDGKIYSGKFIKK